MLGQPPTTNNRHRQSPPTNGKPGGKRKRLAPAVHSITVADRGGGSARPHSRTPHAGSLVESAVDPLVVTEPLPVSLDDMDGDVD